MDSRVPSPQHQVKIIICLIFAFIVIRLVSLGLYPLFDTTEARYGEIARIMFETQNWITPFFDYHVPFWGKPPMHTWASALSFQALGVSEFSARLPHFLAAIASVFMIYDFAKRHLNVVVANTSALILISSIGFIIAGGMVMTDAILTFAITLAMVSFWDNYTSDTNSKSGLVFFVALSIGMLVKGPVAVVIIGIALVTWSITNRCLLQAIKSLPWISGLLMFSLLTFPWYIVAESSTPGFLEYFLWGEHIQRFLESGWKGDLYGSAHDETKGTIWLFWLAMTFPWSFVALFFLVAKLKNKRVYSSAVKEQTLYNYLIAWLLAPMLLFTFAGNILPAYVLPGLPAFALWLAPKFKTLKSVIKISLISLVFLVGALTYVVGGFISKTSQVQLIGNNKLNENVQLYYWQKRPFSSRFYSNGKAKLLTEQQQLNELLTTNQQFLFAVRSKNVSEVTTKLSDSCLVVKSTKKHSLFRCN